MSVSLLPLVSSLPSRLKRYHFCPLFSNAEGEEHLRQRRLQLPFSFTTGEGVLYDTGPTVNVSQFQFNKMFANGDAAKNVAPGSLLDSFLKQDEAAYTNASSSPLPVDQVFLSSRALVSIPSDTWTENGTTSATGVVKEEAKQSMMDAMDSLDADLCSVLQELDVDNSQLMQWENALSRLSQSDSSVGSQLESVLTSDIFGYIDSILFKEGEDDRNGAHPSCFSAADHQQEPFGQAVAVLCKPPSFPTPSLECSHTPHAGQQEAPSSSGLTGSSQTFNSTRKLSHPPPGMEAIPSQLALVPNASATFQPCGQVHLGCPQPSGQISSHPQAALRSNGDLLQSTVEQQLVDILSPLVPCADFKSAAVNAPLSFSSKCLSSSPQPTLQRQVQEWQQSQHQLPQAGVRQSRHEHMPARHSLVSESAGLWQSNVPKLTPGQQGGLACSRAATQSSCMFDQHFSCSPAGGAVTALSGSSGPRWGEVYMDQSPPQGSCYFQWSQSGPVVGTSAISEGDASAPPLSHPSCTEHTFSTLHYSARRTQTDARVPLWATKQLQNEH